MIEQILFGYRDALKEKKRIEAILDIIQQEMMPKSPIISDMPKGKNGNDRMADYMAKVDDLQRELERTKNKAIDEMNSILEIVDKIDDAGLRQLLTNRYIHGYKWEDIATAMNYNRRQIFRLKKKAIIEVSKILDDMK